LRDRSAGIVSLNGEGKEKEKKEKQRRARAEHRSDLRL